VRAHSVPVVDGVAHLLGEAPVAARAAVRLGLRGFEWTTFPRRFSNLPLAERSQHLARVEARPGGPAREVLLLVKALVSLAYGRHAAVRDAVGFTARCALAPEAAAAPGGPADPAPSPAAPSPPPPAAPPLDRAAMTPPEGVERCDVVVIGSGAGGAAAARVLAEGGLAVVVVEEGDYHDASTYSTDPLEALPALYRQGGMTVCEGRPAIPVPLGRCVGGTTVINSGTCFRTPGDVLRRWRDEFGIAWAPGLDGHFESVERDLRVTPVDPETAGRNAALCRAGADAIGASNGPISRNAGAVACCGTCPTGCAIDAKQATHVSELPRAVAAGCRVRAGVRARRVIVEHGRAAGVECRTASGRYEVRARAVVVAAGAVGTPELLLSQGVANSSGQIGRNLRIHPACWVGARFDEEVRGWDGVMQSWYVDQWHDRGLFLEATFTPLPFGAHWLPGTGEAYKREVERYADVGIIGVHLSEHGSHGRVRIVRGPRGPITRLTYRLTDADAASIRFGIARAADIHFAAGARAVFPQVGGCPPLTDPAHGEFVEHGRFRPADLRLEAFHPMGTARMGSDRRASVVSPTGEAHDLPGLFVADASLFPTSLGVNPMITVMACARQVAGGLAERLA
jgi:choline dehydrogenase-like flavoprotein